MSRTTYTATATAEATGATFSTTVALLAADAATVADAPARRVGRDARQAARCAAITADGFTVEFARLTDGRVARLCTVCRNASGTRPEFAGVMGGQCFPCRGGGMVGGAQAIAEAVKALVQSINARRRAEARALVRGQAGSAQADAVRTQWLAARPELARWLESAEEGTLAAEFAAVVRIRGKLEPRDEQQAGEQMARDAAHALKVAASRHAGAVGETVTLTGTVRVAKSVDSRFGRSLLVIVAGDGNDAGVTVKAFTSAAAAWSIAKRDARVTVTGAVKALGRHEGVAETELTRIQIAAAGPAEQPAASAPATEGQVGTGFEAGPAKRPRRRYTAELRKAADGGLRIVESVTGRTVTYQPRHPTDSRPWASRMADGSVWLRYSGGECRAEAA